MKKFLKLFTFSIALIGVVCLVGCSFDSVTSLSFNGLIKQEFEQNEALDVTIKVTVDGVSEDVDVKISNTGNIVSGNTKYKFTVEGFDTTTVGNKTYTITLDGSTLSCYYVVKDKSNVVISGSGTEADPFVIYNTTNFLAIQDKIYKNNDGSTKYFKLANNLNFYGVTYTPITIPAGKPIDFNGNNKTISNVDYKKGDAKENVGLFSTVQAKLSVRSLTVDSANIEALDTVAVMVGNNKAEVSFDNVTISNANIKANARIGAFVGQNSAKVSVLNCTVEGSTLLGLGKVGKKDSTTTVEDGKKVGLIIGQSDNECYINNFNISDNEIYGCRDLGLLIGSVQQCTVSLNGDLAISGTNKVVATVTAGGTLGANYSTAPKASAGALFGTWMEKRPSGDTSLADYHFGLKTVISLSKITISSDFSIFAGEDEVLFDRENGYFAEGNKIQNVLLVSSSDKEFGSSYKTETFIRFIGAYRVADEDSEQPFLIPFVK